MNMIYKFFNEIYTIIFVMSIIYILYNLSDFLIKFYSRVKLGRDTTYTTTKLEKIMLWVSIAIFFTYIIN